MPLYRFTIRDGTDAPDPEPVELSDDTAAKGEAAVLTGEMLRDADGSFWENSRWCVEASDEAGTVICTISVRGSAGSPPAT